MVTCPRLRQSFSLPQCSVQCPLPLPPAHSPPFPVQNMPLADIFSLEQMAHLAGVLLSFSFLGFLLDRCLSSDSKIYLISPTPSFLLKCQNTPNVKEIKSHRSRFLFVCFLAEMGLQMQFPGIRRHDILHVFRHISETNIKAFSICSLSSTPFEIKRHWAYSAFTVHMGAYKYSQALFKIKAQLQYSLFRFHEFSAYNQILIFPLQPMFISHMKQLSGTLQGCPPSHFLSCTDIQSHDFLN